MAPPAVRPSTRTPRRRTMRRRVRNTTPKRNPTRPARRLTRRSRPASMRLSSRATPPNIKRLIQRELHSIKQAGQLPIESSRSYAFRVTSLNTIKTDGADQVLFEAIINPKAIVEPGNTTATPLSLDAARFARFRLRNLLFSLTPAAPDAISGYEITLLYLPDPTARPKTLTPAFLRQQRAVAVFSPGRTARLSIPAATLETRNRGWYYTSSSDRDIEDNAPGVFLVVLHGTPRNTYTNTDYTGALAYLSVSTKVDFSTYLPDPANGYVEQTTSISVINAEVSPDNTLTISETPEIAQLLSTLAGSQQKQAIMKIIFTALDLAADSLPSPFNWLVRFGSFVLRRATNNALNSDGKSSYVLFLNEDAAISNNPLQMGEPGTKIQIGGAHTVRLLELSSGLPISFTPFTTSQPLIDHILTLYYGDDIVVKRVFDSSMSFARNTAYSAFSFNVPAVIQITRNGRTFTENISVGERIYYKTIGGNIIALPQRTLIPDVSSPRPGVLARGIQVAYQSTTGVDTVAKYIYQKSLLGLPGVEFNLESNPARIFMGGNTQTGSTTQPLTPKTSTAVVFSVDFIAIDGELIPEPPSTNGQGIVEATTAPVTSSQLPPRRNQPPLPRKASIRPFHRSEIRHQKHVRFDDDEADVEFSLPVSDLLAQARSIRDQIDTSPYTSCDDSSVIDKFTDISLEDALSSSDDDYFPPLTRDQRRALRTLSPHVVFYDQDDHPISDYDLDTSSDEDSDPDECRSAVLLPADQIDGFNFGLKYRRETNDSTTTVDADFTSN